MPGTRAPRRRSSTPARPELDIERVIVDALRRHGFDPWSSFPPVLRVEHIGRILGVRPGSVSEAARRGRIPMRKRLGKWVIGQPEFRAWVAGFDPGFQVPDAESAAGGRR